MLPKATRVTKVIQAMLALKVPKAKLVLPVQPAPRAHKVNKDFKASKARPEQRVPPAPKASKVPRESKANKALPA